MQFSRIVVAAAAIATLAGCSRDGDIDVTSGVGITAVRSACPVVAVPQSLGDITLFDPPASREARAIDVTASITNVRSTCVEQGDDIVTTITFDVNGQRARGTDAARQVVLPYFTAVVQGGTAVNSKRVSRVALDFAAGQARASTRGQATAVVNRAAATLPQEVRDRLTRRRRAGDADAAVDPLTDPATRQAVLRATFEALVGFQLTDDQLRYNATR